MPLLRAQEVAETFPELVVYDTNGKPETVSYHLLATLLLNEVQKERRVTHEQTASLKQQSAELEQLKLEVAKLAAVIQRLDQPRMLAAAP